MVKSLFGVLTGKEKPDTDIEDRLLNDVYGWVRGKTHTIDSLYDALFKYTESLRKKGKKIIISGDYNTAHHEIDLARPKQNTGTSGFMPIEREKLDFERGIIVQVEKFNLLETQMETAKEADKVAGNGYQISLKRFQNGEISITDLNISLSEREKGKRDYIASLEDYWQSYYYIRTLTLYDFELHQKIIYSNPSLSSK